MSPQRTNLVLAADVPDIELCVLVCDGLDVEADGWNGGDVLVELELVEDGCAREVSDCAFNWLLDATRAQQRGAEHMWVDILVFPAASRPNISRRISLDPKTLAIILEIDPPMVWMLFWYGKLEPCLQMVVAGGGGGGGGGLRKVSGDVWRLAC